MSMSLPQYVEHAETNLNRLAMDWGMDPATLYRIASGERGCRPETAEMIRRKTDGLVTPNDLHQAQMAWKRKAALRKRKERA